MITCSLVVILYHHDQGHKSMFKHGGGNIVEKYTFRLWDVLRDAKRPVFVGGFGGMPPERKILNGAIWCIFGSVSSLKNFLNYYFTPREIKKNML